MLLRSAVVPFLLVPALSFGDFIGGAIDTATKSINKGVGKVSASGFEKIKSSTLDWAETSALSGATSFIFNSDEMSSFWSSDAGSYATGAIGLCYKRVPPKTAATPDICSMLGNTDIDACDLFPSTLGNGMYVKKTSAEQMVEKKPLNDWCKKTMQSDVDIAADKIQHHMGISGKDATKADGSATVEFLSETKREISDKSSFLTNFFDNLSKNNRPGEEGDNAFSNKYRRLHEAGLGHVANNEIKRISELNKDITPEELGEIKFEVAFKNMSEYKNDLYAKTASDAAAQRQFFNFEAHLDTANGMFSSLNQQMKGIVDKKSFIDEYVDNEDSGLRKQYRTWAEEMAAQEIAYTLPKEGRKYYSSFSESNVLRNVSSYSRDKDVLISIANNEIVRQQYDEKTIMLKWRTLADEKADELKVLMVKNMYASEVFDEAAARAEIQQLMAAE